VLKITINGAVTEGELEKRRNEIRVALM